MPRNLRFLLAAFPTLAATGCGLILGVDDFTDAPGGTSQGGGGSGGTTGSTGGATTTSDGGSGGTTTTTDTDCTPGEKEACYDGPADTKGVGACTEGVRTCNDQGTGFNECKGQVLPAPAENCLTPGDDNCDGLEDKESGCCTPNQPVSCYTGPAGTLGEGQCAAGSVLCPADGVVPAACPDQVLPADEFCSTANDEDCNKYNCWVWSQAKGTITQEYSSAIAVQPFTNNILVAGAFSETIDLGGGDVQISPTGKYDAFLATYAPDGTHLWSKGYGKGANDYFLDADVSMNGIVVAGYYEKADTDLGNGPLGAPAGGADAFIAFYGTDGAPVTDRKISGSELEIAYSTKITTDGIVVAGEFTSPTLTFEESAGAGATLNNNSLGGVSDLFVAKYSMTGDVTWRLRIGGPNADTTTGTSATMDADFVTGNAYVAGKAGGGTAIGAFNVPATSNFFLTKLDAMGDPLWVRSHFVQGYLFNVVCSPKGSFLGGTLSGPTQFGSSTYTPAGTDIVVNRYANDGTLTWSKTFGGTGDDTLVAMARGDGDSLIITGKYTAPFTLGGVALPAPNPPNGGYFVARLDTDGNVVWVHPLGALVVDLAVDSNGFTVFTGELTGTANFGGGAVTSAGVSDIFFGKLGK